MSSAKDNHSQEWLFKWGFEQFSRKTKRLEAPSDKPSSRARKEADAAGRTTKTKLTKGEHMTLSEQWEYFQEALFEWSERHSKGILVGCFAVMAAMVVLSALLENGII